MKRPKIDVYGLKQRHLVASWVINWL